MDKQTLILQNNFDQAYNEYRQYKELLESEPPIDRDSLTKFAEENQENFNLVVEEIFNRQSIPSIKRADLISLQINLKNIFTQQLHLLRF
jgi:ribosomal protein L16 Arg81 hydroxylase